MIYLWLVILILLGAVITLYILFTSKPKGQDKQIQELKREIITDGKRFEQLEFRLESLRDKIAKKRSEMAKGPKEDIRAKECLDEVEKELIEIVDYFSDKSKGIEKKKRQ